MSLFRLVACLIILMLILGASCCDYKSKDVSAEAVSSRPPVLEFYAVRDQPSIEFSVAFQYIDGSTWYREGDPGLQLCDIVLKKTAVGRWSDGSWTVEVTFKKEREKRIREWSRARLDDFMLFMIDGKPHRMCRQFSELQGRACILGLSSNADAARLVARIKKSTH